MKQAIYLILILSISATFGFSQTAQKSKTKLTEIQKLESKREKFDPKRDPHLDLQNAIAKANKENKRIILDIGGEWCGWCRLMDIYFMQNAKLDKLRDKNYVWVKINMSEENENKEFLAGYPEIPGYPHLYILEKDGTLLHSQNTADLEEGKSYNLKKFTNFLNKWKR